MKLLGKFVLIQFVLLASFQVLAAELSCRYLHDIEQAYLNQHILEADRAKLVSRMQTQYVKRLDPSKIYLLAGDVKWAEAKLAKIFTEIKSRKCDTLTEIQARLTQRVRERVAFAKKYLDAKFKFDPKTELVLSPDKRSYYATAAEADAFQKKYIQFQISNYLATDQTLEEAKTSVLRSYDRNLKRISEIPSHEVYASYLDSFAHTLDPHSSFFSKDVLEDFEIGMKLSLEGIGATLSSQDGFTTIEQLVPGGGAERSGKLKPKDQIIAVGDGETGPMENVVEMELREVVRRIRGKKGTKVRLSILRKEGSEKNRFMVTIVRDKIKLEDEAAQITYLDRKVGEKNVKLGLLNLPSFYADSRQGGRSAALDVKKLLAEANEKKVDGLVLDLSQNGGGSLDDAVKIAGLFFKVGNVVKQSERGNKDQARVLRDTDPQVDWAKPLVILISRISASASEIVSGAMKDYRRAVIVGGDHTFGKGSVQSVMPIPQNLGALKITVGMFFIPGGMSTQHSGVDADIVLPSAFSTEDIGEKTLDFSLPPVKLPSFISAEAFVTEGQGKWDPVKPEVIQKLSEQSKKRVEANEKFKEIIADLKKAEERDGIVKLEEVMKEKDKAEKEKEAKKAKGDVAKGENGKAVEETATQIAERQKKEKMEDYLDRPDVQEALNVLGDYLGLLGSESKNLGKKG